MKGIKVCVFQTLFLMINIFGTKSEICPLDEDFHRAYVGLSLSPVDTDKKFNEISIMWGNDAFKTGDKIVLFTYSKDDGFREDYEIIPTTGYGTHQTKIQSHFNERIDVLFVEQCKRYYVAWMRDGYIRKLNCLSNQPTWMYDRRDFLGSFRLAKLFIPGTHDSGVYKYRPNSDFGRFWGHSGDASIQDQSVLDQLLQGIRYIHVQVGYYPKNNETVWWIHKKNVPVVKLDTVIDDVKTFLQNTREIVIFDVQAFPVGFESMRDYIHLLDYLRTKFVLHLPPIDFTWNTPLHHIWDSSNLGFGRDMGKVLFNFNLKDTSFQCSTLEHSFIRHTLIDSRIFDDYLEGLLMAENRPKSSTGNALRVTFVTYTSGIFDDPSVESRARDLADKINPNITIWYQKYWYPLANIVALDYFEASGIVDVAIKSNEFRYKNVRSPAKKRPFSCFLPEPELLCSAETIMNSPAVMKLLVPRIVNNAPERIYEFLPKLIKRISNVTLDYSSRD